MEELETVQEIAKAGIDWDGVHWDDGNDCWWMGRTRPSEDYVIRYLIGYFQQWFANYPDCVTTDEHTRITVLSGTSLFLPSLWVVFKKEKGIHV